MACLNHSSRLGCLQGGCTYLVAGMSGALGFAVGWLGAAFRAGRLMSDSPPTGEWCDGLYRNRRGWWFQRQTGEWEGPYLSRGRAASDWGQDRRGGEARVLAHESRPRVG